MECGCHVVWRVDNPNVLKGIEFCPLHAAAEQMLETLKEMVAIYPQLDRVPRICIERAKEVIAIALKQDCDTR